MRRPIVVTALLFVLAAIAVLVGSSPTQAKPQQEQPIPWIDLDIASGISDCIDFDNGSFCGPFDPAQSGDTDGYPDLQEIALGSDPNNAASTPEYALLDEQTGSHTCGDGIDNDLDGHKDLGDSGCRLTCDDFGGKGRCADPDRDGWLSYVEAEYGSEPDDPLSTPETLHLPQTCTDGVDNDGDGFTDAADSGCGFSNCIDFDPDSDCLPF